MEQNKSPFEEIFKKEESRKKEEEEETKERGILDALDDEEKSLFEGGASDAETLSLDEEEGSVSAEKRYIKLLNELVAKKYYEEAIRVIGEMKAEFGK